MADKQTEESEKSVFIQALERSSPGARAAYLDSACRDDVQLRENVERLLEAHLRGGDLLDVPDAVAATSSLAGAEGPGTQIGPYKLREQIGEGGFGVVYVAEQEKPVTRKVALKIIKPGMDTKHVIARFEAERQALALMDHPNVARVLDAGATASGRPYFVMELVKGVSIAEFCDEQRLSNRERLELFVDVCRAVQHAHQKGIIHRDLKPSNVMVTMRDDRAIVKVIDFGVSKALSKKLTEKTVYTAYGQMIGTPLYMSPEQAQMNELDVDTRSDVYSLGVLLYELLTGTTPFDKELLKRTSFEEVKRIIREVDPPRPSARVSTLNAEALSTVSSRRKADPRKLGRSYSGELDCIVMKALEKDRNRRYESASALAADVCRYLNDEPLQARPPSLGYRFGKFARRNKAALVTVASVVAALVLGAAISLWQAIRAQDAAERASQEALVATAKGEIARATGELMASCWTDLLAGEPNRRAKVRMILDRAAEKAEHHFTQNPLVGTTIRIRLANMYVAVGDREKAEGQLHRAEQSLHLANGNPPELITDLRAGLRRTRERMRLRQMTNGSQELR